MGYNEMATVIDVHTRVRASERVCVRARVLEAALVRQ